MKNFRIVNVDSVYDFFIEVFERTGRFDPAIDLHTLKSLSGAFVFTQREADVLDNIMLECFIFCVLNDLNIDTIASMAYCDLKTGRHAA